MSEIGGAIAVAVLNTAVDPIIVIDGHGTIVQANAATASLFGYDLDQLVGHNVNLLMPEPYHSEHDKYIERYINGGEARIIGLGREVTARRADGSVFPISLAVSQVEAAGQPLFTGIVHDLTERHAQRDELRRSNELLEKRVAERTSELESLLGELARSNRDLEQFAAVASHDLQAPLRNVRQGLELLDEHLVETVGDAFDDEANELRSLVIAAVGRMEELIGGLLAYARVQSASVSETPVDLNQIVNGVCAELATGIADVSATVTIGDLPTVNGDATQLHQLVQNLVENSIRYRSNDRDLTIEITGDRSNPSETLVRVQDNGVGIDPALHGRIFELFRRGHSGYDGVGLGLAICQRIAERHGGRIWVESSVDKGATFVVAFVR